MFYLDTSDAFFSVHVDRFENIGNFLQNEMSCNVRNTVVATPNLETLSSQKQQFMFTYDTSVNYIIE